MSKVIEGLYYTNDHEWIKVDDSVGLVGITDFAQDRLGDIAYVELPDEGAEFAAGETFGVIESVKVASDLLMPVAGKIIEKNTTVEDAPEGINNEPYECWFIKIEISDSNEISSLLSADAYTELTKE